MDTNYIVIELQTTNGSTSILTNAYSERDKAEQKYHQVLSYAAVSNVQFHSVSMLDQFGSVIKNECYTHQQTE